MKIRTISISLSAMLLATLLVPVAVSSPVQAQSQTSWSVNDNPTLFGPQQFWFHGASGHGYGTNNYRYTYAIGGDPSPNNWARWNMGSRVGQQEIQVYVPTRHATATVNYNVTIGGGTSKVRVAQNGTRGWYSLGNWNTNGANVVVAVYDNDAEQHHERNGLASSSIGVDAIRMRCVSSNCGEPEGPPSEPRNVSAVAHGTRQLRVTWSPPSDSGSAAISHYTVRYSRPAIGTSGPWQSQLYRAASRSHLSSDLRFGTTYTATVIAVNRDNRASNPATDTATTRDRSTQSPSQPQNVSAVAHGTRQLRVTWSPPSDSGSAPISHYTVRYSRPAIGTSGPWQSRLYRAVSGLHLSPGLRFETTYTATVIAVNRDNRAGRSATDTGTTRISSTAGPTPPRNVIAVPHSTRQLRVTWSPPLNPGSVPIKHYTVRYSRSAIGDSPPWRSRLYTTTSNSHTSPNLRFGTTYTVAVAAVNRDDRASRATTTRMRTTTLSQVDNVEYEIGPHETRGSNLFSVDTISWDAVPGATSYEFEWEYPDPKVQHTQNVDAQCRNNRCSTEFLRNPRQRYVEIRVRAKAGSRVGPWSRSKTGRESIECAASVRDVRYRIEIEGLFKNQLRIYAAKDFRTASGKLIEEDQKGGKLSDGRNISIRGCSWIYSNATVKDSAIISGNAVIYGNAEASGSARVYGDASVSGNAKVSGNAHVYGDAIVYGDARVSGSAMVYGKAKIFGEMEISSGHYDGEQEYERAVAEIEKVIRARLVAEHRKCWSDEDFIRRQVTNLLHPPSREWYAVAEATYAACQHLELIRTIIRDFTPSPAELIFGYAAGIAGALRLPLYVKSLLTIIEGVENLRQLRAAGGTMAEVLDDLEGAYEELS